MWPADLTQGLHLLMHFVLTGSLMSSLIPRCLTKIGNDKATGVLIVPYWTTHIGVRVRSDLGGRRPVCPKKLRSAPLLDCRNQLFTPSKCTKKHAFTIVERHKIVRNRNTVFRTSHTLCRFTRSSNDRVTKQATRSSN